MDLEQLRRYAVLKICGFCGLIISFGLAGIYKGNRLKERIDLLEDFYQMVLELKSQISYFKEPLPDIFIKVGKTKQSKAFYLLSAIHIYFEKKNVYIANLWPSKVFEIYKDAPLTEEDINTMCYLGDFIGQGDYDTHIQHFNYLERKLDKQIKEAKDNYKTKGNMYNKIGFFIGGIVAIIFI